MTKIIITKICAIETCERIVCARGWCGKHYQRWKRYGDPNKMRSVMGVGDTDEERFHSRVDRSAGENDCWPWIGHCDRCGYGRSTLHGKQTGSHRVAYFYANGTMPMRHVLHSCDNPPCCNPKHLREGTPADNAADRVERRRFPTLLTAADVIEIRSAANVLSMRDMAAIYGVSVATIHNVIHRETWQHI